MTAQPPEPTALQLEVLDAYHRARRVFDAMDSSTSVLDLARDGDVAHKPAARLQLAAIRWANVHRPPGPDVVIAMRLVGDLARLDGGATLGVASTPGHRIEGWLGVLWWIGILAGANRLAVGPILHITERMRAAESWEGFPLCASLADLTVIVTSTKNPARTAVDLDSERMALFGALGTILTTATATLIAKVKGWPSTMTLVDWYRVAVETVTGERQR